MEALVLQCLFFGHCLIQLLWDYFVFTEAALILPKRANIYANTGAFDNANTWHIEHITQRFLLWGREQVVMPGYPPDHHHITLLDSFKTVIVIQYRQLGAENIVCFYEISLNIHYTSPLNIKYTYCTLRAIPHIITSVEGLDAAATRLFLFPYTCIS